MLTRDGATPPRCRVGLVALAGEQLEGPAQAGLFGEALDAVSTFVAVGSAMERSRCVDCPGPERLAFEIPAFLRSYYDPLIIASMWRWLPPHEAWWGDEPTSARRVMEEVLGRADEDQLRMLVPEGLLAAALGKVPASGTAQS